MPLSILGLQLPIAGDDQDNARKSEPPGGPSEEVEQQVSGPGSDHSALVVDRFPGT